ncbi:MAG: metallophosphoesterase [Chitinophagaceae bacterium]|nr:metallophosphoesterase [Chitinophagaceae bacterium]
MSTLNRRKFITSLGTLAAALPLGASAFNFIPSPGNGFDFLLLADIHFDKLEHHDMNYLKEKYPNDIVQIENYSRITRENLPTLFEVAKQKARRLNADFYLQLGDFVEGLCGSEQLAQKQTKEFISLVASQQLNRPFFVIKGNHDITGEGAPETYASTVLQWQSQEQKQPMPSANSTFVHKNARFILFDCYTGEKSLQWLKEIIKEHKEDILFFCVHQPVVPFNSRANWHVFAKPSEQQLREDLLNILGEHKAIVLCGHLHKTSVLTRSTLKGNFVQVCTGSVVPAPGAPIKDHLTGVEAYNTDLLKLEPNFALASLQERRENIEKEKPFIKHFEYADFCGYSTVSVSHRNEVMMSLYANVDTNPWRTVNVSKLFNPVS